MVFLFKARPGHDFTHRIGNLGLHLDLLGHPGMSINIMNPFLSRIVSTQTWNFSIYAESLANFGGHQQ